MLTRLVEKCFKVGEGKIGVVLLPITVDTDSVVSIVVETQLRP